MTESMRAEYESKFRRPPETLWDNIHSRYTWSDGYDPRIVEIARQYQYGWEVWQAARAGGEPEPIDDESPKRRIGELGNMLHNLSCELQDNHELADRVSTLACEAWDLGEELSPPAPVAKVPEGWQLVPQAPTANMKSAASKLFARKPKATPAEYYKEMLTAAPHPEGEQSQ